VAHRHLRAMLLPPLRPFQARHLELVTSPRIPHPLLHAPNSNKKLDRNFAGRCDESPKTGTFRWRRAGRCTCGSSRSPAGWPRSSRRSPASCSVSPGPARRVGPPPPQVCFFCLARVLCYAYPVVP
jgi:hypothetical protein